MKETIQAPPCQPFDDAPAGEESPLREILEKTAVPTAPEPAPATLVGRITCFRADGSVEATYDWPAGQIHTRIVQSTLALDPSAVGRECVLAFDRGEIGRPIVVGLLQPAGPAEGPLIIHAENGVVIQSGAARIELREDGEINIQGMYINSQAYGPHRIKGGSVKIN